MRFQRLMLGAMLAALPVVAFACGDGSDDDPTATATTASNADATVPATNTPDPNDQATATPTVPFTPVAFDEADREYAARLCTAFDAYADGISSLLAKDPTIQSDLARLLEGLAPVLETLLDDVRTANPPEAVKPYGEAVEQSVRALLSAVREGRVEDLSSFGTELGVAAPPKDAQDRVRSAALETPECDGNQLTFTPAS